MPVRLKQRPLLKKRPPLPRLPQRARLRKPRHRHVKNLPGLVVVAAPVAVVPVVMEVAVDPEVAAVDPEVAAVDPEVAVGPEAVVVEADAEVAMIKKRVAMKSGSSRSTVVRR